MTPSTPLIDRDALNRNCWGNAAFGGPLADAVLAVARSLGDPVRGRTRAIVEELSPTIEAQAYPRSQSALHGLGQLPLHVDGAHLDRPPRYVVLACAVPGHLPSATTIVKFGDVPLSSSQRNLLETAPFLIRNGRRSFYSTVASRQRDYIRFDMACMEPVSADGAELRESFEDALARSRHHEIAWQADQILVIDNWRALHGRYAAGGRTSTDRKLLRVYVQ